MKFALLHVYLNLAMHTLKKYSDTRYKQDVSDSITNYTWRFGTKKGFVSAGISVRSPRKIFIFIMKMIFIGSKHPINK